ncbi:MAG: DUF547 domain-containing protein [Halobacteriales archaeon]
MADRSAEPDLASVPEEPTALADDLLERVRREARTEPVERALATLEAPALERVREERRAGLAFWLNLYNAATQLLLERRPGLYGSRWRFFRAPAVTVAGVDLSLDDIEHGILRGGRSKYGLGYLPRLSRTGLPAAYSLDLDPRIHFALNCGAASCPAILAYDPGSVDRVLDGATRSYLEGTVEYGPDRDRARLPRLCLWFVGDFGGPAGLRDLLREHDQVPPGASPSLRFRSYDWSRAPRAFARGE